MRESAFTHPRRIIAFVRYGDGLNPKPGLHSTPLYRKILFQNKNGNPHIIRLYNAECEKLHNYVSWVSCPHNNLFQEPKQIIQEPKHIALMVYGQFRSYKHNIVNNLQFLALAALAALFYNKRIHGETTKQLQVQHIFFLFHLQNVL